MICQLAVKDIISSLVYYSSLRLVLQVELPGVMGVLFTSAVVYGSHWAQADPEHLKSNSINEDLNSF